MLHVERKLHAIRIPQIQRNAAREFDGWALLRRSRSVVEGAVVLLKGVGLFVTADAE